MLEGIQKAGGIASLKKVDRSEIRDRSGAAVGGGGGDTGPHGSGLPPAGIAPGGGGGGMADALAAALQKRKEKVSRSGMYLFTMSAQPHTLTIISQTTRVTMMIGKGFGAPRWTTPGIKKVPWKTDPLDSLEDTILVNWAVGCSRVGVAFYRIERWSTEPAKKNRNLKERGASKFVSCFFTSLGKRV